MSALPEARWLWLSGSRPYCDSYSADQMRAYATERVAAERERLRVLVQAVRGANHGAQGEYTFRLLTAQQDAAWRELLAALDGPNVAIEPAPHDGAGAR